MITGDLKDGDNRQTAGRPVGFYYVYLLNCIHTTRRQQRSLPGSRRLTRLCTSIWKGGNGLYIISKMIKGSSVDFFFFLLIFLQNSHLG